MLTGRGLAVIGGAFLLWLGGRAIGSPDLQMVAVGLAALVGLAAGSVRWVTQDLRATRRLSARRVFPGTRVKVGLEVTNAGRSRTPFLLLEDRLPPSLGRAARAVLGGIRPRARQTVSYSLTARSRGRYRLGPLAVYLTDPYDLARRRIEIPGQQDLVVYPEVERLAHARLAVVAAGTGESAARRLFRTGEDFYTMRAYQTGDDLRRIHWPSTARTGQLMIRQDEAARRSAALVFLDTRAEAFGGTTRAFERAVSVTASMGSLLLDMGFDLQMATPDLAPGPVTRQEFLDFLAAVSPSRARSLTPALLRLRHRLVAGATFVAVTHPPPAEEVAALTRVNGFGPRFAILVYPRDPQDLALDRWSEWEGRGRIAQVSLARAGWEAMLLAPGGRLRDVWQPQRKREARTAAASW